MQENKFNSVRALYKSITDMTDSLKDLKRRQEEINAAMYKLRRQTNRTNKDESDLYIYQYNRQLDDIEIKIKTLNADIKRQKEICRVSIISLIDETVIDENDLYNKNLSTLLRMLSSFFNTDSVELIKPKIGDKYTNERINSIISTEDRKLDNRIAKLIRCGYVDGEGNVLIEPIVCVYQYDKDTIGEKQKEVDVKALKRIKDKAKARPSRDYFAKLKDTASIMISSLLTLFFVVLFYVFNKADVVNYVSENSVFTSGQVIAFFYLCAVTALLLMWYNVFKKDVPNAVDYMYFVALISCVAIILYGIIFASPLQIVSASIYFIIVAILLLMRIKLNAYSFDEIFVAEGKAGRFFLDLCKKYPLYLTCAFVALSEIAGYAAIKTDVLLKYYDSKLFITEAVFIGLIFVTIFISSLGKISNYEICARDYVFVILGLDSLALFVIGRFTAASISVLIGSAIVLSLSLVYIILRIVYREIKNEK